MDNTQPNQWQMLLARIKPALRQPKVVLGLFVVVVVIAGLGVAVMLSQRSQENRSDASSATTAPDVIMSITEGDTDANTQGIQLAPGATGRIDLKVRPQSFNVIGVEATVFFKPDEIEILKYVANTGGWSVAQTKMEGADKIKFLVLAEPGKYMANEVNLGNIQFKMKKSSGASAITYLNARFIVDNQQAPVREINGLANEGAQAASHAVTVWQVQQVAATNTPAPICGNGIMETNEECDDGNTIDTDLCKNNCTLNQPTATVAPTTPPTTVSNAKVVGNIVRDPAKTKLDSAGNAIITYKIAEAAPSNWQVNVVAAPSDKGSYPYPDPNDTRVRSDSCKGVTSGNECTIIVPKALLAQKSRINVFANIFTKVGDYTYYCNWDDPTGNWVVLDAAGKEVDGRDPDSSCVNTTLENVTLAWLAGTNPTATVTPTPQPASTATPTPNPTSAAWPVDVTVKGRLELGQIERKSDGRLIIAYTVLEESPSDWQTNVVAVPSTSTTQPGTNEERIRSTDCTNVQVNKTCKIEIPAEKLEGKVRVHVFANTFKTIGQYTYYCSWFIGGDGSWTALDKDNKSVRLGYSTRCINQTFRDFNFPPIPTDTPLPPPTGSGPIDNDVRVMLTNYATGQYQQALDFKSDGKLDWNDYIYWWNL